MSKIKDLFDPSKDIYRSIEKVVTFGSMEPSSLQREISEYVVTDKLKSSFDKVLDLMTTGMESESHEIGIWVSGFYGSGKSSFAKYFGLGLKNDLVLDGVTFRERLTNRINSNPVTQLLNGLVKKYDPVVFLIDLATQQISSHALAPVGNIIYHDVMRWAGYASEEKIALLERKMEMDGVLEDFKKAVTKEFEEDWDTIKFEDKLTAKTIAQELAPRFYPKIWKDAKSFNITKVEDIETDKDKVTQMLDLIKRKSGKDNVLFIIDEVGQYVAADDSLITKMQGLMENLKDIGKGKAWLLATAQQTLTEDNPNAQLNSAKLFKLNDRFPIKIEIEASDIKEIVTQRLLGKSNSGSNELKGIYASSGEMLRLNSRLEHVEKTIYKSDLDEKSFVDLYPFLPHHLNLLLSLLQRLAKKTGGIGLRSAIRVIQDVLTESTGDKLAETNVGTLASTAHIYNVLKSDIRRSYPHVTTSVDRVIDIFKDNTPQSNVAKSIATLQILDDFHLSLENLAAMMHPMVEASSQKDAVKTIIVELKNTPGLTLSEIDGQLRFMTDAIIGLEKDKEKIHVGNSEIRKVYEGQIEDIFTPVPSVRVINTKSVKTGIQFILDGRLSKLLEPSDEIQTELHFVQASGYTIMLEELKIKSTEAGNSSKIYFLGQFDANLDATLEEIVRCVEISSRKNKYTDKEIIDYLNSQYQEAEAMKASLRRTLVGALEKGEFIFRGTAKACKNISSSGLREAANSWLKTCAEKVYHKYELAPEAVESIAAQKILQFDNLKSVSPALNHFSLIRTDGSIDVNAAPLKAINEYLQKEGQVDGKKLLDHFNEAEFGWHKDTTRYLITIMFLASEIKLRIAGDYVTVKGPLAIEKLSSGAAFNQIGITLHKDDQPTQEQKLCAAKNLTELTLNTVPPLPQKIAEAVMKHFPDFLNKYAAHDVKLKNLGLLGIDKSKVIQEGISEILKGDASDATFRLGKPDAELYLALIWAKKLQQAFDNGIETVIKKINDLQSGIDSLPNEGLTGDLKTQLAPNFEEVKHILQSDDFFEKAADLKDKSSDIESTIADVNEKFREQENQNIQQEVNRIKSNYHWGQLDAEQKQEFSNRLDFITINDKSGLDGIRQIINEVFSINSRLKSIEREIEEAAKPKDPIPGSKKIKKHSLSHLPKRIEKKEDIDTIITEFTNIKSQFKDDEIIDLNW
ncbi:MAG: BREX system P-loop protein BrxC [Bacteroidetes bacterium]|nr:BREX system P-loop protein BrxC [Bacteroidota bacterium]